MGPSSYFAAANAPEADDYLHVPDTKGDKNHGVSFGGCLNIATLIILALSLLMLFAGYPILSHFMSTSDFFSKLGIGLGGTNSSGQIPQLPTRLLVDTSTPDTARVWTNIDQQTYTLVFSDEFEQEGRTFWPGDDPYWEAVDIWYGATGDYEWYSPEAINTTGGHLVITMTAQETHNLNFQSGMLQSWNKFCFQGGYIEFSLLQPGGPSTSGYWPAAWLMGNLARPGYLGSTDGMWPYSYSSCDTGILPNQTFLNQTGPEKAIHSKAKYAKNGQLSRLSGMRAPACTCKGQDHPGPNNNVGRSAPEIDIIEAQIQSKDGSQHSFASQSIQTAPFDVEYFWGNKSTQAILYNSDTVINTYHGSVYQEAVSSVTQCPDDNFPTTGGRFVRYGVEYEPDWNKNGGGFTRWYVDGKATWEVKGSALGPVPELDIGQRLIPAEPMSIIMNLGMSSGFQPIDFTKAGVSFPAQMKFDYVRLYQQGQPKVSCDPSDYPTADYIKRHPNLYTNPNLTRFDAPFPLNKLTAAANGVDC
ncbi:glycoside hydrolase family 16 protein [Tilletiaria anomala UBC 951]|uniref:Glycoside hydrolase family 16 protein n=1 Tax=Tilletiaria anomala (strain ATCC 24038 / CBS 436.72 / UBC 951) TaxID=1037660 RepID=A0A066VGH5_TILAU|nr:glycoside hydrolase family 16 protein [Tilletiaria anomala UBC 951]KDN39383.1 glycoside hydrolase family 16 protein [Tilletiaria anomala UBC 951]